MGVRIVGKFELREYENAGCMQMENRALAIHLFAFTNGAMCNGCPKHEDERGGCPSLRQMEGARKAASKGAAPVPVETVREEAARLNVSIGEVRRRRNAKC